MRHWFADIGATRTALIIFVALFLFVIIGALVYAMPFGTVYYGDAPAAAGDAVGSMDSLAGSPADLLSSGSDSVASSSATSSEPVFRVTHIDTPDQVKAVYLTSWAAGSQRFRDHFWDLASTTEINAVVIDIKDYTGKISFSVDDPELQKFQSAENRIPDIKEFIGELHDRGIYVIGRLSAFQDSHLINIHPEWAVKTISGDVWKDYKGVKWLEVGATPVWDYLVDIARYSHSIGFDEINFDYIRFPSDGNLRDIEYHWTGGKSRPEVLSEFFAYVNQQLDDLGAPISADLFGLTTSAMDDLGIGQILEDALTHFDYVAPMVYPSHYGAGFNGIPKPAREPYKVVKYAMDEAVEKAQVADISPHKLRPWLQDFDLGGTYTPDMVRAQIQATYDSGLSSWMLWNAGSKYQKSALNEKGIADSIAEIPPLPEPVISDITAVTSATATSTVNASTSVSF